MNPYDIDYEKLPVSPIITDKSELLKLKLIAKIRSKVSHLTKIEGAKATGLDLEKFKRAMTSGASAITLSEAIQALENLGYELKTSPLK